MKSIKIISSEYSKGVENEIRCIDELKSQAMDLLDESSPEAYISSKVSLAPAQYPRLLKSINKNSKILDIGVGYGQSSVCLAMMGMQVFSLEPSPLMCDSLNRVSNKFDLGIQVVQGVAEDLVGLGESGFDAVFFNASLHHCDDPVIALKLAYKLLARGGAIFLVNENFLRPWRSKAWFYRMLDEDPDSMAHYGGNEHVYYNWDYATMLKKAEFGEIEYLAPAVVPALEKIEQRLLNNRIEGRPIIRSAAAVGLRAFYYSIEEKLGSCPWMYGLLAKLSLVPCHFSAVKSELK